MSLRGVCLPLAFATALISLSACSRNTPQGAGAMPGPDSAAYGPTASSVNAGGPGWQTAPTMPQDGSPMASMPMAPNGGGDAQQQAIGGAQRQGASNEAQDFGVAPTQQLRPTQQLHGPTPTSIPGGQVIGTQQLAQLLQGGQGRVLLLDVYGGQQHLPGAESAGPAAQGGSFDDAVQQGFGQYLKRATGGDTSRLIVVYCGGVQCWSSYNAGLRAIQLGYRNVAWYRGGIEAWQQAGLPLAGANTMQGPAPTSPIGSQQQPLQQQSQPQPPSAAPQW